MTTFTPLSATLGGILIGIAATLLWAGAGRTAGVSNIAGGIIPMRLGDELWRFQFLGGLAFGAWLGFAFGPALLAEIPATLPVVTLPPVGLIIAGLLVGIGTRVGRGCTSGHGICGLARLSVRSFAAVSIFMATAVVTVFVMRHVVA
jgi:uncharacterized membrane protein YedE/YeeE